MNQDPFKQLQIKYIDSMDGKVADLQEAYAAIIDSGWSIDKLEDYRLQVHRLAGSGGSYGFPEVSELSVKLEQLLLAFTAGDQANESIQQIELAGNALVDHLKSLSL